MVAKDHALVDAVVDALDVEDALICAKDHALVDALIRALDRVMENALQTVVLLVRVDVLVHVHIHADLIVPKGVDLNAQEIADYHVIQDAQEVVICLVLHHAHQHVLDHVAANAMEQFPCSIGINQ